VKLTGVRDGSPAQKAGLQANDLIVQLGGKSIKTVEEYLQALEVLKAGEETTVVIKRDGNEQTFKITPAAKH
jgi:S1-C subfamily serine protease